MIINSLDTFWAISDVKLPVHSRNHDRVNEKSLVWKINVFCLCGIWQIVLFSMKVLAWASRFRQCSPSIYVYVLLWLIIVTHLNLFLCHWLGLVMVKIVGSGSLIIFGLFLASAASSSSSNETRFSMDFLHIVKHFSY